MPTHLQAEPVGHEAALVHGVRQIRVLQLHQLLRGEWERNMRCVRECEGVVGLHMPPDQAACILRK